jgi:hypothetical protein
MRTLMILGIALLWGATTVHGQTCPITSGDEAKKPSVLQGTLLVHDEIREWIGLKLERPACGQNEVQLVFSKPQAWREAKSLRGCKVTASGQPYESPTGYYSAEIAISNAVLKPAPTCHPSAVEEDPSSVPIPSDMKAFYASVTVDYRGKGHVDVRVWHGGEARLPLAPWQAYVSYNLNGSLDLIWFRCQKDFLITDITQMPENPNGILRDQLNITGAVLQDMSGTNTIRFSCQRKTGTPDPKGIPSQAKPN